MSLSQTLKELFTDKRKSEQMMYESCRYDPDYTIAFPIDEGYAKELLDLGITSVIEAHHGGEGQGDQYWTVYKFQKDQEVSYFKFYGWYASYHGAEFTNLCEVYPKVVTTVNYYNK